MRQDRKRSTDFCEVNSDLEPPMWVRYLGWRGTDRYSSSASGALNVVEIEIWLPLCARFFTEQRSDTSQTMPPRDRIDAWITSRHGPGLLHCKHTSRNGTTPSIKLRSLTLILFHKNSEVICAKPALEKLACALSLTDKIAGGGNALVQQPFHTRTLVHCPRW